MYDAGQGGSVKAPEPARSVDPVDVKSDFMARMSHELRTPLNAVLGFAQMLLNDVVHAPSAWQRERLLHVESAGQQLLALVDQLLLLTADASCAGAMSLQPVRWVQALTDVWQTRAWAAPQSSDGVGLDPGCRVLADPLALQRVLELLLSALDQDAGWQRPPACGVQAMRQGGRAGWRLGLRRQDGDARAQVQASLFDAAAPLPAVLREQGLSLVAASRLLARMGGELLAEPGPTGQVGIWLPDADNHTLAEPAEPLRLLCVEDNPVNMLLLRELLAQRPAVHVCACTTGTEAVACGLSFHPQVALLDLNLPDISGFEVLQALRGQPQLAGCRFIALSANALQEDVALARQAGFDDYWTKPIDVPMFLAALDGLIAAPRLN